MKAIKFIKFHAIYSPGEIAGFDESVANQLILHELAVEPTEEDLNPIVEEEKKYVKLVPIQFLKSYGVYNSNDIAGFPQHKALELCKGKNPLACFLKEKDLKDAVEAELPKVKAPIKRSPRAKK